MSKNPTKVTYSLPSELVDQVRSAVREGAAPSYSNFVEQALREAVRKAREQRLEEDFRQAANDPEFLTDLEQVEQDFQYADAEAARLIP